MKKIVLFFFIFFISTLVYIKNQKKREKILKLNDKYFVTILDEKIKNHKEKKNKIAIFDGDKKKIEFDADNVTAILSVENGKIFYYQNNKIMEYDIKKKEIIGNTPFPENNKILVHMKKIRNKIYYSENYFFTGKKDYTNELFEFDVETQKTKKIIDYTGEGLPLITSEEIIFSRNSKIYTLDKSTGEIKYLWEGSVPFERENDFIYYINDDKIMKKSRKEHKEKIVYKISDSEKIGGKPLKINNNYYLFIKLKPLTIRTEFDLEKTELELVNINSKEKINLNKIYYKNKFFNKVKLQRDMFFTNSSFLYINKEELNNID